MANDVHGKNHWRNGTFGRWVRHIGLLRSDGSHHRLAPGGDSELFAATVGGLGLTGLITDVAVQLLRIRSSDMDTEKIVFGNIAEFFELTGDSLDRFEHTVAWVDCLAAGDRLGRGIFTRAEPCRAGELRAENQQRTIAAAGPARFGAQPIFGRHIQHALLSRRPHPRRATAPVL